jgi:hypothetical protein
MKGVVFLGDRKLELREFPDPTPDPRDVILEIFTHRWQLEQAVEAYELFDTQTTGKAVILPS